MPLQPLNFVDSMPTIPMETFSGPTVATLYMEMSELLAVTQPGEKVQSKLRYDAKSMLQPLQLPKKQGQSPNILMFSSPSALVGRALDPRRSRCRKLATLPAKPATRLQSRRRGLGPILDPSTNQRPLLLPQCEQGVLKNLQIGHAYFAGSA